MILDTEEERLTVASKGRMIVEIVEICMMNELKV
jgi:hypothetical protein